MFQPSMIDFLNWNHSSNLFHPGSNRTSRVIGEDKQANESKQSRLSSAELMRSLARWENEGGAVPQTTPLLF
jgi:hypothetical protein